MTSGVGGVVRRTGLVHAHEGGPGTFNPLGGRVPRIGAIVGDVVGIRILGRHVEQVAGTGETAQGDALVLEGGAAEDHVEVEVLVASADGQTELERRHAAAPGVEHILVVDIAVAVAVHELVHAGDEGAVAFAGAVGVVQDLAGIGLIEVLEALAGPVVGAAGHPAAPAVHAVVPPVIHGRSVEAGVLGLDVGLAVTGEGNLSLDPVGEVADAVAMVQGEFQTLVLAAVQVLGRKRDGVEVRKGDVTGGGGADGLAAEPVEGTSELALRCP